LEQGARSTELGAGSTEHGARSTELGAGERGARSREHGARSRERPFSAIGRWMLSVGRWTFAFPLPRSPPMSDLRSANGRIRRGECLTSDLKIGPESFRGICFTNAPGRLRQATARQGRSRSTLAAQSVLAFHTGWIGFSDLSAVAEDDAKPVAADAR
jgi:hypothetical protein